MLSDVHLNIKSAIKEGFRGSVVKSILCATLQINVPHNAKE